jgi:hypothetical protein
MFYPHVRVVNAALRRIAKANRQRVWLYDDVGRDVE